MDYAVTLIFSLTPFGLVAAIGSAADNTGLEYGALGLCAIIVFFLCNHIKYLTKKLELLSEGNTKAYNRLADMLDDRPCLMKDRRIKE